MPITKGMMSSSRDDWETPQWLFEKLDAEFGFTLDPCASPDNAKCMKFYTPKEDGLAQDWTNENVFVNPPYGRQIGKWTHKAVTEVATNSATVVMLLPARTDTSWWHDDVMLADEIRLIRGRLRFGGQENSAPFPSAIAVFRCWPASNPHQQWPRFVTMDR